MIHSIRHDHELSKIIELKDSVDFNVPFRKGFKLMLHEDTVDEKIAELTSSIKTLYQLQNTGTSMRQIDATVPSKNSKRLMNSLVHNPASILANRMIEYSHILLYRICMWPTHFACSRGETH